MNERIQQLADQAGYKPLPGFDFANTIEETYLEKFAQLLIEECVKTIENRAPGQMGKQDEGWTNGYDDGLKTGAFLIKKHFGVE